MTKNPPAAAALAAAALKIAQDERHRALSSREWQHRLKGYGYGIKKTNDGAFLTDLIGGRDVCALPAELTA